MARDTIHILGIGNLGKFLAHSIRRYHPETPITLLFHRASLVQEWKDAGEQIDIIRNGRSNPLGGFNYEVMSSNGIQSNINNLIVATKTYATVAALKPLKDQLDRSSTMLFVQNGVGTIDEVNTSIFSKPSKRPKYLVGIISHGLFKNDQFSSTHAGFANMVVGPVLSNSNQVHTNPKGSTAFMEHQLLSCESLNMSLVPPQQLLYSQLQKLAVNAVINPLSVIFDRLNGELFKSRQIETVIRALIVELSTVMQAIIKAKGSIDTDHGLTLFSSGRLEEIVFDVGEKTAKNISSMRQDVLAGRKTEIDYMNGYITAQAVNYGLPCPLNTTIVELVKAGETIEESQITSVFGI